MNIILNVEKITREYKKQSVKIPLESISLELKNNIFNLAEIEADFSFPFQFPASSEVVLFFGHVHEITRKGKHFGTFAASLEIFGTLYKTGIFTLKSANGKNYKGTFKAKTTDIAQIKNQNIREILKNELYDLGGKTMSNLNKFANSNQYPVTFPTMEFLDNTVNFYANNSYYSPATEFKALRFNNFYVPCFRLTYIVKKIFENVGYKEKGNFENYEGINNVILLNNRPLSNSESFLIAIGKFLAEKFGTTYESDELIYDEILMQHIPVKNHVPNWTLKQLIEAFRKFFGAVFLFDSLRKTYEIKFYDELITEKKEKEWTYKTSSKLEDTTTLKLDYKGFTFSFAKNNDPFTNEFSENLESLNRVGIGKKLSDTGGGIPSPNDAQNKIFALKIDNSVYLSKRQLGYITFSYQKEGAANYSYSTDKGVTKIHTDFMPCLMDYTKIYHSKKLGLFCNLKKEQITTIDNLKINYIKLETDLQLFTDEINKNIVQVKLSGSQLYDNEKWINIRGGDVSRSTSPNRLILEAEFIEDENEVYFEFRSFTERFFPRFNTEISLNPESDTQGVLALYHGKLNDENGENPYPFASSGNISPQGDTLANFGLRWKFHDTDTQNLFDVFFKAYDDFFKQRNEVQTVENLNFTDLKFFDPIRKIRIRDTLFFVKKLSVNITNEGIKPTKAVLWKLGATECKHEIQIEVYKDCYHELTVQIYSEEIIKKST